MVGAGNVESPLLKVKSNAKRILTMIGSVRMKNKMLRITDCAECPDCERVEPRFAVNAKLSYYCSNPALDNPTIWERPSTKYHYPDFGIPEWCPLEDAPGEEDE